MAGGGKGSTCRGRDLVVHLEAEGLSGKKVVVALLHQVLVGAAELLLEGHHRHQLTDGSRGRAHVALLEQRTEDALVPLGGHKGEELVEPALRVVELLRRSLAHKVNRVLEKGQLGIGIGLSKHISLPYKGYAS